MNGYDVAAHVEFEIEQLKEDVAKLRNTAVTKEKYHQHCMDIIDAQDRLVEVLELRIAQLEQSQKDLRDIKDYYQDRIGSKD